MIRSSQFKIVIASALVSSLLSACGPSYNKENPSIGKLVKRNLDVEKLQLANTEQPQYESTADEVEQHQSEAIENYRAYINLLPEGPAKQQAMRRLADLLVTQGPQATSPANAESPADFGPGDGLDGTAGPTTLYKQLLNDPSSEEQKDVLLYQLARAYLNDGKPGAAVETLRKLALQFPSSKLVGEANLRRGELQFIRKNYEDARQAYDAVLTDDSAQQYHEQALYKSSWALYKLEQHELALDRIHELLDPRIPQTPAAVTDTQFDPQLTELPRAKRELVQDALRVQSLALAWLEASTPIEQYLSTRPKRHYESLIYARLSELYSSRERYRDAARTLQTFVNNNPQHAHAPLFSAGVIEAWETAGFVEPLLQAQADYALAYAPQGPFWGQPDVGIDNERWVVQAERAAPHVITQVRQYTQSLAAHYHAVSQQSADAEKQSAATEAGKWYEHYLSQFPSDEATPNLAFLYGELLFENQRWQQAASQYTDSAYKWHRHEKSADAAYGAVLSWRKLKEAEQANNGGKFTQASIDAAEQMVDSSLMLADNFPAHPEVARSLVVAVEDLYVLGDLAQTITIAKRVIDLQPPTAKDLQLTAWLMTAQAEMDLQAYPAAELAWAQTLALSREVAPQDLQKHSNYVEQLAASIYYQAQNHLAANELEEAVSDFMRVVSQTPSASIVTTAHYDAANTLMQMEAWQRAQVELSNFRQRYPNDERQPQIDRKLATTYLSLNQPGNAAREFQRIGLRATETADTRREALWRSAELYDEAQWSGDAYTAWERYVSTFPAPFSPAIEARQRLIELAIASGNGQLALQWQQALLESDQNGGEQRNDRSRFLASRAARELALLAYAQFERLQITPPFKTSLAQKKAAMTAAIDSWNTVQNYRFADQATEAAFHQAEIQANLAHSLISSVRPTGLSELALEEYELLLEEQAEPFEASAVKAHEGVTRFLIDQDLLDDWVRRSAQRLAELYPARWSQTERGVKYVEAE